MGLIRSLYEGIGLFGAITLTLLVCLSPLVLPLKFVLVAVAGFLFSTISLLVPNKKQFFLALMILSIPLDLTKTLVRGSGSVVTLSDNIEVYIHEIFALILLGTILFDYFQNPRRVKASALNFFTIPVIVLFLLGILSMTVAADPFLSICELSRVIKGLLVYAVLVLSIEKKRDLSMVLLFLGIGIIIQGILAVIEIFVVGAPINFTSLLRPDVESLISLVQGETVHRAGGSIGHSNSFSVFIELQLPLMFALIFNRESSLLRNFALPVVVFGLVAIALAMSRMGIMATGVCVGGAFVIIAQKNLRDGVHTTRTWLVMLLCIGCMVLLGTKIVKRFQGDDAGSADTRILQFEVAQEVILANPLLGVGINNYKHVMHHYDLTPSRISKTFPYPVHNIYLLITAEMGIFGFLTFMVLIIYLFFIAIKNLGILDGTPYAIHIGACFGLFAYFIHIMVDMISYSRTPIFFVIAALLVITDGIATKRLLLT